MSWVNLDDVYVNKSGDSIAGNLSVGGALTINDGKGTDTTYNVANEITTLRDSVSPTGFTCLQGSIESGTYCAYICIGHLVCVIMNDMPSLGTKGVLPKEYRPPTDIIGFGYVRGTNTSGQILVNSAGEVGTWCNQNNSRYFSGSVCYVVEQYSVSHTVLYKNTKGTTANFVLSEAVTDFEYVDIYYKSGVVRMYPADYVTVVLSANAFNKDTSLDVEGAYLSFSEKSATFTNANHKLFYKTNGYATFDHYAEVHQHLAVILVLGYKQHSVSPLHQYPGNVTGNVKSQTWYVMPIGGNKVVLCFEVVPWYISLTKKEYYYKASLPIKIEKVLFSCSESTQWRCDRTRVMIDEDGTNEINIAAKIDSDAPNATVEDPYLIPIKVMIIATIQYSVSHDYIVAQGESGIWFYRKWNSGLAEFCGGKELSGQGSVTAPAVDFPFPLTRLLYKGASAIYSSGLKGICVLSGTGASASLVDTGVYVLKQDITDNSTTTVASIEYNVKGLWK